MEKLTSNELVVLPCMEYLRKYVPVRAIQELVDEVIGEQENLKHTTKEVLLHEVLDLLRNNSLSIERVDKLIKDYKFAGRVSVCWGISLKRTFLSKDKLQQIILSKNVINPFIAEIRPTLTKKPAFNNAEWLNNHLLRLEFVYAGKEYEIEDNYEKRIITPTKRINSYLRILENNFVLETRANIREIKLVHDCVSMLLGIEIIPMTFSNQDIAILKKELSAKSKAVKRKRDSGDIDTLYVSASPDLDDLDNSEEYRHNYTSGELKETRLEFVYINSSQHKIETSLYVSNQGHIWFTSDVPEEIIEHTFTMIRKIKFLPPVRKLGIASQLSITDENKIQSLIMAIRTNGYGTRFNPRIYRTLGFEIDEKIWMETISKLLQLGHIIEQLELVCPACYKTINVYFDYNEIPLNKVISCNHCGRDFAVSERNILLIYSFKEDIELNRDTSSSIKENQIVLAKN